MDVIELTKNDYPLYLHLQEMIFGTDEWPPVELKMMDRKNYIHLGLVTNDKFFAGISAKITKHTAELVLICTLVEMRGKGIANLLLLELVERLRKRKVNLLFVENYLESAKSWYLSHGFEENDLILELKI